MKKDKVFLSGASGSLGFQTFIRIWDKKQENGERKYNIVLLLLKSKKNLKLLKPYMKESGITDFSQEKTVMGKDFSIIWGNATNKNDINEACKDADWVINCMALISPQADRNPKLTMAVNVDALENIIKSIKAQKLENHTRLISIGSIAQTGDRLANIYKGRVGDPLYSSIFDIYTVSKIKSERLVVESGLKYWAFLRQTFIMIPDIMSLEDPILFHSPIDCYMENNTSRDAGRGLANCLDIDKDSDFWRRVYNFGGGESCRIMYLDFVTTMFGMLGIRFEKTVERNWFALRNFHMQYYEDSYILNEYIHNYGDSMQDYFKLVWTKLPWYFKLLAKTNKFLPPFRNMVEYFAKKRMLKHVMAKDGTLNWYLNKNDQRITAYYGSYEKYEAIEDWDTNMPGVLMGEKAPEAITLDHGYNEDKDTLDINDLQEAAKFRGGKLISDQWDGDLYAKLEWECCMGHTFTLSVYAVLKAGHWCPECEAPPWNYDAIAKKNPFFAQVWYTVHDKDEDNFYPEDCFMDIID